ncbi:putative protein required for cell viability protein [Rutstroemia sp. NJR-2017a BBW]|nr:putative protein required for cell viability protein [Rutstroemia sp. NJR-2017a BBW]
MQTGKLAFDPDRSENERSASRDQFNHLIASNSTLTLMPILNLLVQPDRVQPWLRAPIIQALARLPLRPRGVQDTIEFVFSIHPSNANRQETVGSRSSNISYEALSSASRLLSSPPQSMSPEEWFNGIGPQLLELLDGKGEREMDKAAAYIIGFGILGRKMYGAPGAPGWKALVEPILGSIDPNLAPRTTKRKSRDADIVELGTPEVLVSADELGRALKRLHTLVTSHPHPSLTKRLLNPIFLPLWSISSWYTRRGASESQTLSIKLLKILLQLTSSSTPENIESPLSNILHNILFRGRSEPHKTSWVYAPTGGAGDIQIVKDVHIDSSSNIVDISRIDPGVRSFITLMKDIPELESQISVLFLSLFRKWLAQGATPRRPEPITISILPSSDDDDAQTKLIEAKLLQEMITEMPEKLVQDSKQCLELVNGVLSNQDTGADESEDQESIIAVALSLLNIVLTSPNFRPNPTTEPLLEQIESSVSKITRMRGTDVPQTAQNLLLVLQFRNSLNEPAHPETSSTSSRTVEERKTYNLAMSYLTSTESPPPVKVQGIDLLQTLIKSQSTILDIPALLVLFSSLLQDSEEYVYLRAIRSFVDLAKYHPKAVLGDLIERYVDGNEDYDLDARLRLGEALLQVIQSSPITFTGPIAKSVCEGLLSIAGRRGYRPKTEKEQIKRQKLQDQKNKEAEEAWDGPVPQLDDVLEEGASPEYDILSQIISGWESKRGAEDVRIRASALTILGSAIECNISGIGSQPISMAVDLSIHILTLEPEVEKGILRRSAILLIMSFIRALDSARSERKKLGFGFVGQSLDDVQRILKYVEETDNDGLVREHAKDVIEGIEAWQMNSLLPVEEVGIQDLRGISSLAGLSINPGGEARGTRPRIEEIE